MIPLGWSFKTPKATGLTTHTIAAVQETARDVPLGHFGAFHTFDLYGEEST